MRIRAAAFSAIMMVLALPAVSAQAAEVPDSIEFQGAGWGHGVGMSQWGSYGRTLDGQDYVQILTADGVGYYQGATIGMLGVNGVIDPGPIFTNVASDISTTVLTVFDGPGSPRSGMQVTRRTGDESEPTAILFTGDTITIIDTTPQDGATGGCEATLRIGGQVTVWPSGTCDFTVALTPGTDVPGQVIRATNCRTNNCTFGIGAGFHLVDNGSSQRCNDSGCHYDRIGGPNGPIWSGFDMVVDTTLDEYTRGIAEVPFSWPVEALKTQAVAARSYAASFVVSTDHRESGCFCDVKNSSSYQVYAGWIDGWPFNGSWDSAAKSTDGEILVHPSAPDANIVRAYYSSSNGGASEWVKEKWGADLPYLVSVPDPFSLISANSLASWTFTFTADAVVDAVWGTSADYTLTGAGVNSHNVSGSAKTVQFSAVKSDGTPVTKNLSSASVTAAFGLYSWYFEIDDSGISSGGQGGQVAGPVSVGVQDPRTGIWMLRFNDGTTKEFYYGNPMDIPFIGDWNGNGVETVGLYRESAGFLFLRNSNDQGNAHVQIFYGIPGDKPIAGDWNGDGTDTIGIYRPSEARFYLRNSNTQGVADVDMAFGSVGDVPIAGDWNGDGIDTVGVWRPSTGMVYLTNSVPGGTVDISFLYSGMVSGDRIVTGDWNLDGIDTIGLFRPSNGTFYLRDTFTQTSANITIKLGSSGMNAVAGFWGG